MGYVDALRDDVVLDPARVRRVHANMAGECRRMRAVIEKLIYLVPLLQRIGGHRPERLHVVRVGAYRGAQLGMMAGGGGGASGWLGAARGAAAGFGGAARGGASSGWNAASRQSRNVSNTIDKMKRG